MLYVNHPQDTAPKLLMRSDFEAIITSSEVARHCLWAQRYAQALAEARLRGDALQVAWWERELKGAKGRLPAFLFQGTMRDAAHLGQEGTRNGRYITSNGKAMIDIDHIATAEMHRIAQAIATAVEEDGTPFARRVGFVATTPSGQGLRIVMDGRVGSTLVADQQWVAQLLGVVIDECCKDYTRLSFAVPEANVLHYDPEVLFRDCVAYEDGYLGSPSSPGSPSSLSSLSSPRSLSSSSQLIATGPLLYDEAAIIAELEQEIHGAPVQGNRNNFVYRMAHGLRHLYGDNLEALCRAIPTYGLSDAEHRGAIRSALSRPPSSYVPHCIYRRRGGFL